MKFILFIAISLASFTASATDIRLEVIKDSLVSFLKETEGLPDSYTSDNFSNFLIRDLRIDKEIKDGMNGIFLFSVLSAHDYLHYVLVDGSGFEIINMRESFENNLKKLLNYFNRNNFYTKDDILFYINDFIRVYDCNNLKSSVEEPKF